MDEPSQGIDGEKLDLPLNQEPGTAAPEFEIKYEIEREKKTGNRGEDDGDRREPDNPTAGMLLGTDGGPDRCLLPRSPISR